MSRRGVGAVVRRWYIAVMEWPPLGRLVGRLFGDVIPAGGGLRIVMTNPAVPPRAKTSVLFRRYERRERALVERYLPPDQDVLELGSSLGVLTTHIAARLRPGRRVVAVEADPVLVDALREAVAQRPDVVVEHCAVVGSGEAGTGVVAFGHDASSLRGSVAPVGSSDAVSIDAVTIPALVARHHLGRFSLVCDIEGSEWAILDGAGTDLAGCTRLVMEIHPRPGRAAASAIPVLEAAGFRVLATTTTPEGLLQVAAAR